MRNTVRRGTRQLFVPSRNLYGLSMAVVRSHVWYFVLLHCGEKLKDHSRGLSSPVSARLERCSARGVFEVSASSTRCGT